VRRFAAGPQLVEAGSSQAHAPSTSVSGTRLGCIAGKPSTAKSRGVTLRLTPFVVDS